MFCTDFRSGFFMQRWEIKDSHDWGFVDLVLRSEWIDKLCLQLGGGD